MLVRPLLGSYVFFFESIAVTVSSSFYKSHQLLT